MVVLAVVVVPGVIVEVNDEADIIHLLFGVVKGSQVNGVFAFAAGAGQAAFHGGSDALEQGAAGGPVGFVRGGPIGAHGVDAPVQIAALAGLPDGDPDGVEFGGMSWFP